MNEVAGLSWCKLPTPVRKSLAPIGAGKASLILAIAAAILPIYPVPTTMLLASLWFFFAVFIVYYFFNGGDHVTSTACPGWGSPTEYRTLDFWSTVKFFCTSTFTVIGGIFLVMSLMALVNMVRHPQSIYELQKNLNKNLARDDAVSPGAMGFFTAFQTVYEWMLVDLIYSKHWGWTMILVFLLLIGIVGFLAYILTNVATKKEYQCRNSAIPVINRRDWGIRAFGWATLNTLTYIGYYMIYFIPMTLSMWGSYHHFMSNAERYNQVCTDLNLGPKDIRQAAYDYEVTQNTTQERLQKLKEAELYNPPPPTNANAPPAYNNVVSNNKVGGKKSTSSKRRVTKCKSKK